jgi:hypothetical protein
MDNSNPEKSETTMSEDIAHFFQSLGSVRTDLGNGARSAKTIVGKIRGLFDQAREHVKELETLFDQQDSRATMLMMEIDRLEGVNPPTSEQQQQQFDISAPDFSQMCLEENVGRHEEVDGSAAANEGES